MAGPPGPREAQPEDKLDLPVTHRVRVGGRKESRTRPRWVAASRGGYKFLYTA
jgi:hypothetical protein